MPSIVKVFLLQISHAEHFQETDFGGLRALANLRSTFFRLLAYFFVCGVCLLIEVPSKGFCVSFTKHWFLSNSSAQPSYVVRSAVLVAVFIWSLCNV